MSILKIARMGHPVLRRRADTVEDPTSPEIQRLIVDMIETMEDAEGAGLAAPQVHVLLRLVVFHAPAEVEGESPALSVLINPEISPLDDEMEEGWEGCLSVPGLIGLAPRHHAIRYTALAPDGSTIGRLDHRQQGRQRWNVFAVYFDQRQGAGGVSVNFPMH